jgi:succinate dehydrogenase/fumarate reductase cytochrome b subunit
MNAVQRRLLGESVREVGVLTLVFVPLDMLLESRLPEPAVYPLWLFWLRWMRLQHWIELVFAAIGVALLYFGIKIEAKAELENERR